MLGVKFSSAWRQTAGAISSENGMRIPVPHRIRLTINATNKYKAGPTLVARTYLSLIDP